MLGIIRRHRHLLAFTLIEVMAVSGIMSTMASQSGSAYRYAINKANEEKGLHNLRQLHLLLQAQCIGGEMPRAAFYPKGDPKTDPTSIVRLVQGGVPELFVSPFAPEPLKQKGLTYAWNDAVNGKDIGAVGKDAWLLIDMAAFLADPKVSRPEKYLVLYADGRAMAISSESMPADIDKVVKEAISKGQVQK